MEKTIRDNSDVFGNFRVKVYVYFHVCRYSTYMKIAFYSHATVNVVPDFVNWCFSCHFWLILANFREWNLHDADLRSVQKFGFILIRNHCIVLYFHKKFYN